LAGLLLTAWSLALIAWLTLHWGILPRLDDWRPQIERRVGDAIGVPLSIGAIRVSSGGWIPAFELDDVRLLDRQGRVALALGRVSAALSPASLWALEPRFAQLHLDGVRLDVRRDARGRLSVAGLDMAGGTEPTDPVLLDWFLEQYEFVIRHGTLRWTDEQRDAGPLTLSDVDLVLRNGARRHELRIDATPPADWGRRFALRGRFTQPLAERPSAFQHWRGTLYAELPEVDVSQLRQHLTLPFALERGRGALRGWFDLDAGRPTAATADLALDEVVLRLAPKLPPLALAHLRGRVQAASDAGGLSLTVERLGFTTDDGVPWAPSTLRLALKRDPAASADAPWAGGELRLDHLSLAPLARLAARLPLPPALHGALASLAPQGEVTGLALDWSGPPEAPWRYRVAAHASDLTLAAGPPGPPAHGLPQTAGRPGLRGATLSLEATERGGQSRLVIRDGAVQLPGVFEDPQLPLQALEADLAWTVDAGADGAPPAVVVQVRDLQVRNADLEMRLGGSWRTGPGQGFGVGQRLPGVLELQGRLLRGDPARVARYLPLGVPAHARSYVARAFSEGRLSDGEVAVQGDLWRFPFVDGGPGTFRLQARVQGLRYAYLPSEADWVSPWPAMTAVTGVLEFDRAALRIRDARAQIGAVVLQGVKGGVEDLVQAQVLRLDGQARGPLPEMLRFVNSTPVGDWTGGALRQATAAGTADLALALTIPLAQPAMASVRGGLQLAGNELRLLPGTPLLTQARGRIDFTERGFTVSNARARALGGELGFDGGTQADGRLRFQAQGQATAEGLLRSSDLPVLAPLAALVGRGTGSRLRGQAPYRLQLEYQQGVPELLLTSPLTGLSLDLPAPLSKPAAATWPLRLQTRATAADADRLTLDIDGLLQARLDRRFVGDEVQVPRGSYGLGTDAPALPAAGLVAAVALPRLDLDAWRRLQAAGADGAAETAAGPLDGPLWPTRIAVQAGEVRLGDRGLQQVVAVLQRRGTVADTTWRVEGRAAQAEGWLEWQQPRDARQPGRLSGHLARLTLPEAEASAVQALASEAALRVPSLALVVDQFSWRGKALGKLEVEAENRRPVWQLERIRLSGPDATFQGRGLWAPGQRSTMAFDLALSDGGAFFERLGAGKAMQGAAGRIEGELSWPGSPLAPDVTQMRGQLSVALGEGRFLNAEPGVARLFGVLSLQALPRRLLLDFRDVFQQGMAFDRIEGDIALAGGVARTRNLRVLGVQAAVLVEGSADLRHETQDLRIVAVPELNTTGASLAWVAVNPVIGVGAFIAQLLLNKPMTAAATREFHVTGPWGEPKVDRVEHTPAAAASAAPASATGNTASPTTPTPTTP
jgi:uncharacterized protein (TIGR02099 family)